MKRRVIRTRISRAEVAFGAAFLVLVVLAAAWVAAQRDNYDPSERDISFDVLAEDSVEDTLYRRPLRRWVEPGSEGAASPVLDLGIFPADLLDGGWSLDGRVETYDADTLYEKINGAAEQYMAFGFRQLHYATLARDGRFLNVELYDQGSFPNALGIFSAQRDANREVRRDGSVYFYDTPAGAVGGVDQYYFKISGDRAEEAIREKAFRLAAGLGRLPGSGDPTPRGYAILTDGLGLPMDRVAYQRNDAFQYEFFTDVWFGRIEAGEDARFFVHQARDGRQARTIYDQLLEEQSFDYADLERGDGFAVLRHLYLETVFAVRVHGDLVLGVEGAADETAAREYLRRLYEAAAPAQRAARGREAREEETDSAS
jgi:hypothetical protein